MRLFLLMLTGIAVICLVLFRFQPKSEFENIRNDHKIEKDQPFVLIQADPRSGLTKSFILEVADFIESNQLKLPVFFSPTNDNSQRSMEHVTTITSFDEASDHDHYYFVGVSGVLDQARLMYGTKALKTEINRYFDIAPAPQLVDYFLIGDDLNNTILESYDSSGTSAFILLKSICMVCKSGSFAQYLSERVLEKVDVKIIVFEQYDEEELSSFERDYAFEANLINVADRNMKELWDNLDSDVTERHVFQGAVIGADERGGISFVGNIEDLDSFEEWIDQQETKQANLNSFLQEVEQLTR